MVLGYETAQVIIFASCIIGIIWAWYNYQQVSNVTLDCGSPGNQDESQKSNEYMVSIGAKISDGAKEFLKEEYKFCVGFLIIMAVVLWQAVDNGATPYTTIAFLIGGLTSIISGYISMAIAVGSNYKVSYKAKKSLSDAFRTAFCAGCSMGFVLVSIALAVLGVLLIVYFNSICGGDKESHIAELVEVISGYGLGGSTVALFGRVGGGIYTKAADVGADLVGKVEHSLNEDSPRNPATIADNVGDNVGDVAGMGSDLFGSFAESTCAALVVSGTSLTTVGSSNVNLDNIMFPLLITACGLLVSIFVSALPIYFQSVKKAQYIESTLKDQLIFSTFGLTAAIVGMALLSLPGEFYIAGITEVRNPHHAYLSTVVGLWSGLLIGFVTEYYTSHSYLPVREVSEACRSGAATNIIYGLALGYNSCVVPVIAICISAYVSHKLLGFYGVALAALGMLSNLPIGLTIDGYGPISDNAGGIAEMSELGEHVRDRTDALDAAGNTTAAIGKGFAIGSAALVSLALYGGYITRVQHWTNLKDSDGEFVNDVEHGLLTSEVTDPLVFGSMLLGAMLPYLFSAFTMKSVGLAAQMMVKEIQQQLKEQPGILTGEIEPDYNRCIKVSTQASLKEMVAPGLLVIVTPLVFGFLFGPKGIAGLLPGALISGVQMAISAANTGGAWDNAKKYIEAGNMYDLNDNTKKLGKGTDLHKAAVIGDTVGDPLKDTSGPSLNILVKLMAILSLVFAEFFCKTGFLVTILGDQDTRQ